MNIFEEYKHKILTIIKNAEKNKILILPKNLRSIKVDTKKTKIDIDKTKNG